MTDKKNAGGGEQPTPCPSEILFYKSKDGGKKVINTELFSVAAEKWADCLAPNGAKHNQVSQLRKFYDEVLRLNNLVKQSPKEWENVLPYVNMLIAKAAYAEGRGLVNSNFVNFMKLGIEHLEEADDLQVFAHFFEAFMGFFYSNDKLGKSKRGK